MLKRTTLGLLALLFFTTLLDAQKAPSPFDFGKMWTFENPPKEWFEEEYGFSPDDKWFEQVRMSSLRFASWCSASFVSPDGLIMTNHHCSRDVVGALQQEGENFDTQGFIANSRDEERRAADLFVEQLNMTANITDEVMAILKEKGNEDQGTRREALEAVKTKYAGMDGWKDLRLQTVTYYSGGRYSLYGYKKFSDIRLVWIPELDLGLYGGDPDNFTYPRYNLDCTFWRAYDEEGNPLNTSANYLKFNEKGAEEGEATFVVGNPGRTERYRTYDQLKWDREYRYNMTLRFMKNRHALMMEEYNELVKDPTKTFEAQEKLNSAFGISNGIKAYGGILKGLHDPELMGRKEGMEQSIKSKSSNPEYWNDLSEAYKKLEPQSWAIQHLAPSGLRGSALLMMHELNKYEGMIKSGEAKEEDLKATRENIVNMGKTLDQPKERKLFKMLLEEIKEDIYPGDNTLTSLLDGMSIDSYVDKLFTDTKFKNEKKTLKCLKKTKKVHKEKDMLMKASRIIGPRYAEAGKAFQESGSARRGLEAKIANEAFNVYGDDLPPDATFTLRISDGVVKGYEYNGTEAPYKTTYFGLYDRHFSNDKENPWSLPERWQNPPMEFLKAPINFVSTNDIIGGNSGSPMINMKGECVGLIFDGNIESLPGNFIFDEEYNRTVSVHSGGIVAALRYIYKADALVTELVGK